jgi:hypothetical protein
MLVQMRKTSSLFLVIIAAALAGGGCGGRSYHLPGHTFSNRNDPPDMTMRVGERRKAITTGFTLSAMGPAFMDSSEPEIVAIEHTGSWNTVYLRARKAGVAIVRYGVLHGGSSPDNDGFAVRVLPAK